MFLPAIAVAVYRYYLVEASVYTYTMFFSTVGINLSQALCQFPLSIRNLGSIESNACCVGLKALVEQSILELHKILLGSLDMHLHGHVLPLQSLDEELLALGCSTHAAGAPIWE